MLLYIIPCLLVLIYLLFIKEPIPKVYYFNYDTDGPLIVILSGTHGNEQSPALYLQNYILQNYIPGYRLAIVPFVNARAIEYNVRNLPWQPDINRSWPDKYSINKYLKPIIDSANLVIDFHEGWGFSACNESLGQTIYTTDERYLDLCHSAVSNLNKYVSKYNIPCMEWSVLDELPPIQGTLDGYCSYKQIPYILVELSGQNDITPIEIRFDEMQILLSSLVKF